MSRKAYSQKRADVILISITSRALTGRYGALCIETWRDAGLNELSWVNPQLYTVEKKRVLRRLGWLDQATRGSLRATLHRLLDLDEVPGRYTEGAA